jgi:hypothetical protein
MNKQKTNLEMANSLIENGQIESGAGAYYDGRFPKSIFIVYFHPQNSMSKYIGYSCAAIFIYYVRSYTQRKTRLNTKEQQENMVQCSPFPRQSILEENNEKKSCGTLGAHLGGMMVAGNNGGNSEYGNIVQAQVWVLRGKIMGN